MQRRQFSLGLLAGISAVTGLSNLPAYAQAQPLSTQPTITPEEGKNYLVVQPAIQNDAPEGKVQVIEFFAYSCSHCYRFSPIFDDWAHNRAPANAHIQRVPVSFREVVEPHARIFYTLEALNRLDMHEAVFATVLTERINLISNNEISSFFQKHGVDSKQAMNIYNSFGIQAKVQQANKIWNAYGVDATPAMGIGGQFRLVGADKNNLIVAQQLIERISKPA
ncbi:MAG: thiol:disulfide interchange protein DsbA/DsbL [Saezia sp.]